MNIGAGKAVIFVEVSLKSGWEVVRDNVCIFSKLNNTEQTPAYLTAEGAICNIIAALWKSNLKISLQR
jgi:hypothetical protein